MNLLKSETAKTFWGVLLIIVVFFVPYTIIISAQREENPLMRYEELGYLPGFPYYLPLLDIPISEDFDPWARRTGFQIPPEIFMHLIEFRIDQETNTVHIKTGITSPNDTPLEEIFMTFRGHNMVWTHRNQDVWWLNQGTTYFRFTLPVYYFRNEGLGPMQWHMREVLSGEILIFEARIER